VALDLDDDARRAIARVQRRVATALGADRLMKAVDPAHMHLTLVFLGETAPRTVPAIVDRLSTDIDMRPFEAEYQGLGVFPPSGAPRILWLGVGQGGSEIIRLQREAASRLAGLGVTLERRPFHPHLTLARWRSSRATDRERALSAESRATVARVNVDHLTLYQSRLSPAGPAYTALTRANLT
jgi:2'-5' RNA ligase